MPDFRVKSAKKVIFSGIFDRKIKMFAMDHLFSSFSDKGESRKS